MDKLTAQAFARGIPLDALLSRLERWAPHGVNPLR